MPIPTIYYVRHGETEWNATGRVQGWRDIPLNDNGREQAAAAGGILGELLARDGYDAGRLPFIASPLIRSRQTMELVRTALGHPGKGYALDERLREIHYGEWEGMTFAEMKTAHPELYTARDADKWHVPAPGGESYAGVAERVRAFLMTVTSDSVVVAHGGTMRALMVVFGVATPAEAVETYIEQGVVYVFGNGRLAKYG